MCFILYSPQSAKLHSELLDFWSNAHNHISNKNTVAGYGLAFLHPIIHKWSIRKTTRDPENDPELQTVLADIVKQRPILVIGHIRVLNQYMHTASASYENTHPFYYKNRIFVHNGWLEGAHLPTERNWLLQQIHQEFYNHIKGETDSELLFYLFLTTLKRIELSTKLRGDKKDYPLQMDNLKDTVRECFRLIDAHFTKYLASFIYADKEYSIVARFSKRVSPKKLLDNPLFIHSLKPDTTRIRFSSKPSSSLCKTVKDDVFYIINHLTREHKEFALYGEK